MSFQINTHNKDYSIDKAYIEGYEQGLNWPDTWEESGKPGGPWVHDAKTSVINDAWCRGWDYGHLVKLQKKS